MNRPPAGGEDGPGRGPGRPPARLAVPGPGAFLLSFFVPDPRPIGPAERGYPPPYIGYRKVGNVRGTPVSQGATAESQDLPAKQTTAGAPAGPAARRTVGRSVAAAPGPLSSPAGQRPDSARSRSWSRGGPLFPLLPGGVGDEPRPTRPRRLPPSPIGPAERGYPPPYIGYRKVGNVRGTPVSQGATAESQDLPAKQTTAGAPAGPAARRTVGRSVAAAPGPLSSPAGQRPDSARSRSWSRGGPLLPLLARAGGGTSRDQLVPALYHPRPPALRSEGTLPPYVGYRKVGNVRGPPVSHGATAGSHDLPAKQTTPGASAGPAARPAAGFRSAAGRARTCFSSGRLGPQLLPRGLWPALTLPTFFFPFPLFLSFFLCLSVCLSLSVSLRDSLSPSRSSPFVFSFLVGLLFACSAPPSVPLPLGHRPPGRPMPRNGAPGPANPPAAGGRARLSAPAGPEFGALLLLLLLLRSPLRPPRVPAPCRAAGIRSSTDAAAAASAPPRSSPGPAVGRGARAGRRRAVPSRARASGVSRRRGAAGRQPGPREIRPSAARANPSDRKV